MLVYSQAFLLTLSLFMVFSVSIHYKVLNYSSSVKNAIGILIGIALNLQIALGRMVILTILILPVQEHGISSHLFVSSSISFISVLQFSEYRNRSFASLGRFIPKYLIHFDAIISGTIFFIFLILCCQCLEMQQISVY